MIVVRGYVNGHRIVEDLGPSRGRVAGYGTSLTSHGLTLIGGAPIETESERDRQLRMQREAMRRARAK